MAASKQVDTTLVIRARDEATKAVTAIGNALQQLIGTQQKVAAGSKTAASGMQQILTVLSQLDKAYARTAEAGDQGASALERQNRAIAENKAAFKSLEAQQRGAARAAEQLRVALVEALVTKGNADPIRAQLAEVTTEMRRLEFESTKLQRTIGQQESGYTRAASGMAELERQTRLASSITAFAAKEADDYAKALERQAAAAATARNIERANDRTSGKSASDSASAFQSLGLSDYEKKLKADAEAMTKMQGEAQRLRAALDPVGAAAQNAAAELGRLRELEQAGVLTAAELAAAEARVAEQLRRTTAELDGTAAAERQRTTESQRATEAAEREARALADRNRVDAERIKTSIDPVGSARDATAAQIQRLNELEAAGALTAAQRATAEQQLGAQLQRTIANLDGTTERHRALAEAEKADATAVRSLREELSPLQAAQSRVFAEQQRYKTLLDAGKISVGEYAAKQKLLQEQFTRTSQALAQNNGQHGGALGLFGLKPYEVQNLGYQVNDVVTQLASGTSLTQTLAQQGGQILQLFPKVGSSIVAALTNPALIAFVATLGTIVIALSRAADESARLRDITGNLALSADGGVYDPKEVEESARALRGYGASIADATAAGKIFTKEGVNPDLLDQFGRAAQDLVDVTGQKLPEAAKKLAEAFTGGYEAIRKLDKEYDFLSAAQAESIRQAFQDGDAQRARGLAFDAFTAKVHEAAEEQRGNATDASRTLAKAYNDLLDGLANTAPIKGAIDLFSKLAGAISRASGNADSYVNAATDAARLVEAKKQFDALIAKDNAGPKGTNAFLTGAINNLASEITQIQKRIAGTKAQSNRELADTNAKRTQEAGKETAELTEQIAARRTIKSLSDAETTARREATEYVNQNFALADAATKQAYIQLKVSEARKVVQKRLADEAKREADEAKRAREERERLAKQTVFRAPVDGRISSGFGARAAPKAGASTFHKGVDYAVPTGTTVRAPANGVVIETGTDSKLGKFVYIDHGKGTISKFGHLSDNSVVEKGQVVTAGQAIAKSGNTGNSTGAHLHYTVLVNGKPVDPTKGLFPADGKSRFQVDQADAIGNYDDAQQKLADKRDAYLVKLDQTTAATTQDTEQLKQQVNLTGDLLLAAQRQAAIEDAVRKAKTDATQAGVDPGGAGLALRIEALKGVTGAYFDAAHAKDAFEAQRNNVDKPVADITAQRDALREQITFLRDNGFNAEADKLLPTLSAVNGQLQGAIDKSIAWYASLTPINNPLALTAAQLDAIILKLKLAKQTSAEWGTILGISAQQIAQAFASTLTASIENFLKAVVDGQNAFSALKDAFLDFAANFLRLIAQMILQQIAFNIAKAILSSVGVATGGAPIPTNHNGGIAGTNRTTTRTVNPGMFAAAARFHTGGIAGLRPDEVPIIAQKGEEILTRGDPRHRANGGLGGGGAPQPITVVNAIDAGDFVSKGLNTGVGGKALMNYIRANSGAVKQAIG